MEHVRKNITITQTLNDNAEKIRVKKGMKSFTSVVELALDTLYNDTFKEYIVNRAESRSKTPEDRAKAQMEIAEYKKKAEEDRLTAIANQLEGRLETGTGGGKMVVYYTYDRKNRYRQKLPLDMMTEELVSSQYFPSKEDVVERQQKGEVNYNPNVWE